MEKVLTVVCVIVSMVSIALLVSLIVVAVSNNESDLDNICLTQACIEESSTVLSNMNLDADPYDSQLVLSHRALILSPSLQMRRLL